MTFNKRNNPQKPLSFLFLLVTCNLILVTISSAQTYQIPWHSINSGGCPGSATGYALNGSIAQSSIGTGQSSNYKGSFGFWYGMEGVAGGPSNWILMNNIPFGTSGKKPKSGSCMTGLNGKIYLLKASNTQDFHIFTPNTSIGSWTSDTIPLGTKEAGDGKKPKKGASITVFGNSLFALRGNNTPGFWQYKTAPSESIGWYKLLNIPTGAKNPKDASGLVAVNTGGTDYIFAMKGSKTDEFYLYNILTNTWAPTPTKPTVGNSGKPGYKKGSCLCYDGDSLVYVLKGNYGDFFCYNLITTTWTELKRYDASLFTNRVGKKKKPKDGAGLVYYNNTVYMLKGGNTNEFWMYDSTWHQMDSVWDIPVGERNKKVKGGGALTLLGDDFYAAKGANTPEFYRHSPPGKEFAQLPGSVKLTEGVMANKVTTDRFRLSIKPNPANNVSKVKFHLTKPEPVNLKLYDICGKLIKSYTNANPTSDGLITIDAKLLASGVYILRFSSKEIKLTRKLVIEK